MQQMSENENLETKGQLHQCYLNFTTA